LRQSIAVAICAGALLGPARADDAAIARGKYLVTIGICQSCHTENFSGGRRTGGNLSANITSDRETGVGAWSDDQIIEAIRNGVRPDGSRVRPSMGVYWYNELSDFDVRAIVAFLRATPPVSAKRERASSDRNMPYLKPRVDHVAQTPHADRLAYGRYLFTAVAHCANCHTPKAGDRPDLTKLGAGGNSYTAKSGGEAISANLTPANTIGVASWTNEQLKTVITRGVRPDGGKLVPVMDFEQYEQFTPGDLEALVAFLRTLPAATP